MKNNTKNKEGICKVSGRSVIFSAFYADFRLCPKLVIITTLISFILYLYPFITFADY